MAKRGYRGKHPYNDMKVAPTEHKAANSSKLTAEYNRVGAKNKYDFIKSHEGFYPQATAIIDFQGQADTSATVTIVSTDGTSKAYKAVTGTADYTVDPSEFEKKTSAAANATSLILAINAAIVPAVAATATWTITEVSDSSIDTADEVIIKDYKGTTNTFTFDRTIDTFVNNTIGILTPGGGSVTDLAVRICEAINDPSSTTAPRMSCDNLSGVITLTQSVGGLGGNQSNDSSGLTDAGENVLTNFTGGENEIIPGHIGKITAVSGGSGIINLTQVEPGPHGNTAITVSANEPEGGTNKDFTGG